MNFVIGQPRARKPGLRARVIVQPGRGAPDGNPQPSVMRGIVKVPGLVHGSHPRSIDCSPFTCSK